MNSILTEFWRQRKQSWLGTIYVTVLNGHPWSADYLHVTDCIIAPPLFLQFCLLLCMLEALILCSFMSLKCSVN
ncbi:hypothetical protein COLO4_03988 [Corchorus olitorius]|uniref:Uncharacterized protein n=1 Tax=Corchorus olitorius TaxID=93759 RepID=A0A1R3KVN6_9ROSI|nr:hypothetical protein COLO4_03988 [Corchorus olitorius]